MKRKFKYAVVDMKIRRVMSRHKNKELAVKDIRSGYEKVRKLPKGKKVPNVMEFWKGR